jgi:methyl-accepting chemotaxis protein
VADVVADIASASAEQAGGIEQVNKALAQMDEVTQQNSALVEENAATAKTLEAQARAMNERVAVYRLSEDDAPPLAPADDAGKAGRVAKPANAKPATAKPVAGSPSAKRPASPAAPRSEPGSAPSPARRLQAGLATALKTDPDWEEF